MRTKIGYVLEKHVRGLLEGSYKPVSEKEFASRFYKTYPFVDKSLSLRQNLEDWYIKDGITLCKYDHYAELEFRNKALEGVKNRDDYDSLSVFQILDFLYLIDCLIWVNNKMVGVQIASMKNKTSECTSGLIPSKYGNNVFSKYSSVRSPAKRGIHGWLDKMVVIYSNMEYLQSKLNTFRLVGSMRYIANYKPSFGTDWLPYESADSVYELSDKKEHKPFLISAADKEFLIRNNSVTSLQ